MNEIESETNLKKLTKKQLIIKYYGIKGNLKNLTIANAYKQSIIRNMRLRLYKIRNSIDYLLQHPHSVDSSYNTMPHTRDKIPKLSQTYHSKRKYKEGKR